MGGKRLIESRIGEKLRWAGGSISDLSQRTTLSYWKLSRILNGSMRATSDELVRLVRAIQYIFLEREIEQGRQVPVDFPEPVLGTKALMQALTETRRDYLKKELAACEQSETEAAAWEQRKMLASMHEPKDLVWEKRVPDGGFHIPLASELTTHRPEPTAAMKARDAEDDYYGG